MKAGFLTLAAMIILASCKDYDGTEPQLSDQIKGVWTRADNPGWHYAFDDVLLTAWIYDFGGIIAEQRFAYTTDGDTLKLTNLGNGDSERWVVQVDGDTARVQTLGAIAVNFKMTRE